MNNYLANIPTRELQKRHYQMGHMQAKVNAELIDRGIVVNKSETPLMKMIAAQTNYQRKLAGKG